MQWRYILVFLVTLFSSIDEFYGQELSDQSQVLLLTCGPGNELYSTFGHTAIYIRDPKLGVDKVYNYGTFDFDTPNFYLKFCQGELDYFLNVTSFNRFASNYQREGRWVNFQELNLTLAERNDIYAFLSENQKPDNKFYRYRFLTDNCSTRPRDVIETVLGDKLNYQHSKIDSIPYREFLDRYLGTLPWSDFGIDLALGKPCDAIPNQQERMFLPDHLYDEIQAATLTEEGQTKPLVKTAGVLLQETRIVHPDKSIDWIFWTMMVIAMFYALFFKAQILRYFDITLFTVTGIIGILILLLWFATSHAETKWNFNILWTTPSWIYGAYLLVKNKPSSSFFKVHAILMFAIVVNWILIPQEFHSAFIPIILTLGIRSWAWQKQRHSILKKQEANAQKT